MNRRSLALFIVAAMAAVLAAALLGLTGCSQSKTGALSPAQYARIQKGMTMDDVEAVAGAPERSHKKGTSKDPNIVWYYPKTEGEGMVRVSFTDGKVDLITPYDSSIEPEE